MGTKPFTWAFLVHSRYKQGTFNILHSPSIPYSWPQMDQAFQKCHSMGWEVTLLCTLVTSGPSPLKTRHLHVLSHCQRKSVHILLHLRNSLNSRHMPFYTGCQVIDRSVVMSSGHATAVAVFKFLSDHGICFIPCCQCQDFHQPLLVSHFQTCT